MNLVEKIIARYPYTEKLNLEYTKNSPYPHLCLDEFLDDECVSKLKEECDKITWSREFTRNGSRMLEKQDISDCPVAFEVCQQLSSKMFLDWLEKITGHDDLIPDPHMVGAGYMRCGKGDSLKIHSDFNFNNKLKIYRMLTLNIYLNKGWKEEWHGDLQFWDFERKGCVSRYWPHAGRALLWRYHKYGFHGHPNALTCPDNVHRDGLRIFYYVSGEAPYKLDKQPHRSLYWYDDKTGTPYDVHEQK